MLSTPERGVPSKPTAPPEPRAATWEGEHVRTRKSRILAATGILTGAILAADAVAHAVYTSADVKTHKWRHHDHGQWKKWKHHHGWDGRGFHGSQGHGGKH